MKAITKTQAETRAHEGEEVRRIIRTTGLTQEAFAAKIGMTVQNLSYHMRKAVLTNDFRRLLKENGIIPFSKIETPDFKEIEAIENETIAKVDLINYNIPIGKQRIAVITLPLNAGAKDIDKIISHLKLMKEAME